MQLYDGLDLVGDATGYSVMLVGLSIDKFITTFLEFYEIPKDSLLISGFMFYKPDVTGCA